MSAVIFFPLGIYLNPWDELSYVSVRGTNQEEGNVTVDILRLLYQENHLISLLTSFFTS